MCGGLPGYLRSVRGLVDVVTGVGPWGRRLCLWETVLTRGGAGIAPTPVRQAGRAWSRPWRGLSRPPSASVMLRIATVPRRPRARARRAARSLPLCTRAHRGRSAGRVVGMAQSAVTLAGCGAVRERSLVWDATRTSTSRGLCGLGPHSYDFCLCSQAVVAVVAAAGGTMRDTCTLIDPKLWQALAVAVCGQCARAFSCPLCLCLSLSVWEHWTGRVSAYAR